MNKEKLLKDICDHYNLSLNYINNDKIIIEENTTMVNFNSEEEALKYFIPLMKATHWNINEIDFIKRL